MTAYEFVKREKAYHAVRTLCRALGVSPSGYYAWRTRGPSARALADERMAAQMATIHRASRGTYGVPRIRAELTAAGTGCGLKRVARLMRRVGLVGCHRRRAFKTTRRDPAARPHPLPHGARRRRPRPWIAFVRNGLVLMAGGSCAYNVKGPASDGIPVGRCSQDRGAARLQGRYG